MMKFIILALLFIGCVTAATNSSSSTGEASSSTGVSESSSSRAASNSSSSSSSSSPTGVSSESSSRAASNSSSSSTGEALSSSSPFSSTGSSQQPNSTCYSNSAYGNISSTGNFSDSSAGYTLINNNTYILFDGYITSISMVYHETSPSQVVLKRVRANPNNTAWYQYFDQVNITGLINSTNVQRVNLTKPLMVKKGDLLGIYSATGSLGINGLTDGYAYCLGDIKSAENLCAYTNTEQVRLEFTLAIEVPCDSSSSSSSSSSSAGSSSSGSSTGPYVSSSSSSTGAAPTVVPEPQAASSEKSITATGFVVGAASMLGLVLLVVGACWYKKRSQTSTMNSPLLSHA